MRIIILISILIIFLNAFILQIIFTVNIFDVNFLKEFFINLLPGSVAILIGILAINLLIEKDKNQSLKKINKSKLEYVEFSLNRFAFNLLEYLDIVSLEEPAISEDKTINFSWARKRMAEKTMEIDDIFFKKMMASSDRKKFIDEFIKILKKNGKSLTTTLKEIFPHPNPSAMRLAQEIYSLAGGLSAVGVMSDIDKKILKKKGNHPTKEQIDLLIEIAYFVPHNKPSKICKIIIKLHEMAKKNILFTKI